MLSTSSRMTCVKLDYEKNSNKNQNDQKEINYGSMRHCHYRKNIRRDMQRRESVRGSGGIRLKH